MPDKSLKICFAASSGGHFEQLMRLKPLMNKYSSFILTEKADYSDKETGRKTYYVPQINRKEKKSILKFIFIILRSLRIFIHEKPDAIICTGVLATIPMCCICKLFRKKIIYIESFAKVTSPTLSGRLLYKFSDQFYVQWKSMKRIYPKAIYIGHIY